MISGYNHKPSVILGDYSYAETTFVTVISGVDRKSKVLCNVRKAKIVNT